MSRGFREIRVREVGRQKNENPKNSNYLKIKPETDITAEETDEFWDQLFENMLLTNSQEK